MTHIFISYSHSDKTHLATVTNWLAENNFSPTLVWYDKQLEAGSNWRDEIADALDQAFVVLVIVTKNSVKSVYCTYEWAYAMGQGIPVLPLVLDELTVAEAPSPLLSKQFVNCLDGIPTYLKQQIEQLKTTPPQMAAINRIIYETVLDTHRRFFILCWLGDMLESIGGDDNQEEIAHFSDEAALARTSLETLMTEKAFAFSGKQHRLCWKLIDLLQVLSRARYRYETSLPEELMQVFENDWLPAFEYFEGHGEWSKWTRRCFETDLSDEQNRIEVVVEMATVLSLPPYSYDTIIQNMKWKAAQLPNE